MKKPASNKPTLTPAGEAIQAKVKAAEDHGETTRRIARLAKQKLKRARRTFKHARKVAKRARKEAGRLRKALADAIKESARKKDKARKPKKSSKTRTPSSADKKLPSGIKTCAWTGREEKEKQPACQAGQGVNGEEKNVLQISNSPCCSRAVFFFGT